MSEDETMKLLTPSQIRDSCQPIELSVALGQTQGQGVSATLQRDLDMMCQCLGLLYKANVDPTAILEAVAQAREACMKLECNKCLD
jgi:hypothetical protein